MISQLNSNSLQQCKRCIMDSSVSGITFDRNGICNFCSDYLKSSHSDNTSLDSHAFDNLLSQIKRLGRHKQYDCIVGVSGGVDSSWVLVQAVSGLRPLAVHMDNGWNSELAQNNISSLINKLSVDLYTHN